MDAKKNPIGPRRGCKNQLSCKRRSNTATVEAAAIPKTFQNFFLSPPTAEASINATTAAIITMALGAIVGLASQLLNSIAINCLRRTATQKIGNENSKNDTKVIE